MARIDSSSKIELKLTLRVSEVEARALQAMTLYGNDNFVKTFYEKLGAAYMRDHEAGLRSFLTSCAESIPSHLRKIEKAREAFEAE